jgi:hypothetical protein
MVMMEGLRDHRTPPAIIAQRLLRPLAENPHAA